MEKISFGLTRSHVDTAVDYLLDNPGRIILLVDCKQCSNEGGLRRHLNKLSCVEYDWGDVYVYGFPNSSSLQYAFYDVTDTTGWGAIYDAIIFTYGTPEEYIDKFSQYLLDDTPIITMTEISQPELFNILGF